MCEALAATGALKMMLRALRKHMAQEGVVNSTCQVEVHIMTPSVGRIPAQVHETRSSEFECAFLAGASFLSGRI